MTDNCENIFIVTEDGVPLCFSKSLSEARIGMWENARRSKYEWSSTHITHIKEHDLNNISVYGRSKNMFIYWDSPLVDYSISPVASVGNLYSIDIPSDQEISPCNNGDENNVDEINLDERVVGNTDSPNHGETDHVVGNSSETNTFFGYLLGKKSE